MHNRVTSHLWLKTALHASSHPCMCTCALRCGCFSSPVSFFYFFPLLFFQPFQMSSSEFHERLRSNPLCDFRLGTVATSDHETPLTPMEVDAIKLQTRRKRAREASHVQLQQLNFLTAGRVSVEDRSKRAETVRPQLGERCEKRREFDSVLSATNDENGDELNGETDDEDMVDGEMGFNDGSAQVRNIRDPGQPTAKEHREHMTTHRPTDHGANSM